MSNYQEYQVRKYTDHTEWRQNGVLHRLNGPAIEYANGDKSWYQKGKLHREDGPAIEHANGTKYWCLEGKNLTEAEFLERTEKRFSTKTCEGKVIEIEGQRYVLTLVKK